jgi:signal transduction histidine kinase
MISGRLLQLFAALALFFATFATSVVAQEYGTAAEAKAMLEKAVAEVKKNKSMALEEFTKGEAGFKQKDLYPYCGGPDGNFSAHPTLVGKSLKDLKDKNGKPFGEDMYKTAQAGKISEVSYMWTRPGTTDLVEKIAYYTKVDDQICAVGYYK